VKRAGGALEIFVLTGPVESGPPPHAHPWDEAYIGISGEVAVTIGDTTNTVGPGDTITVPAGTLHSFRIMSDTASFHVITSGHRASAFFADVDAQHPQVPTQESLPGLFDVAKRHALTSPLFT
jgi:quercetin dioxygenase-like cupin family protein